MLSGEFKSELGVDVVGMLGLNRGSQPLKFRLDGMVAVVLVLSCVGVGGSLFVMGGPGSSRGRGEGEIIFTRAVGLAS